MLKGHLLNERYQIKETIGGGGMANVYLARDIILDRDVAIKVLRLEYANDEEFIARFDREAQSITSLSHPNIVSIYDVGEEDNILYMVMEYVDGMTLKEYIQRYGPIEVQEALDIMKQITAAISHAHANDIVHRDIKPQNILINTYGQVKVTDFGIAIALSATSLTQTNSILGSVHYLSPEQARGGTATKKSDIYSLGIVLFELLTGRLPFSGQSPVSIALKHLQNDTPSVRRFNPNVPQSVENIVLKATSKDPFHRYNTVYDMEVALDTALNPSKLNEAKFTPPFEIGEETKAIPIITDSQLQGNNVTQDTIIHQTNGSTKMYPENEIDSPPNKGKKEKKKKKKKWLWIIVIFFILFASAIAAIFILPVIFQPKEVEVIDVTNLEYADAKDELEKLNLKTEKELVSSDEVEEDYVVKTDPRAGKTVKEGSVVTIFVSQGKEKVAFQDYVGQDFDQAKRLLIDDGYDEDNIISYEKYSDARVNEIITQISPSPDSEVIPSDTRIIFEISKGPELISLNNLAGMTEKKATEYLDEQNLKINVLEENSDSVPEGKVIRQDPEATTKVAEGTTVDVYISIGPEEKPPKTYTETITVTYNPDVTDDENAELPIEQTVKIYISDLNNVITDVAQQATITKDTDFKIMLKLLPDTKGEYMVIRDGEVIIDKSVSYEEGE